MTLPVNTIMAEISRKCAVFTRIHLESPTYLYLGNDVLTELMAMREGCPVEITKGGWLMYVSLRILTVCHDGHIAVSA